MKVTRKQFLQLIAGSALVAGAGKLVHAVSGSETVKPVAAAGRKRRGMAIDRQRCRKEKGCSLCKNACHAAHNVPAIPDAAHEVKWIWPEPLASIFPYQQTPYGEQYGTDTLPVLCNHCTEPACVRVCPTKATWKRDDGIVMMDYHRCIGCRYCMAACPYGSRSFNYKDPKPYLQAITPDFPTRTAGVVEKCNFCEERLANGLLPACVAACPQQALIFGDLNDEDSALRQLLKSRYGVQRQPELGCGPSTFYLI